MRTKVERTKLNEVLPLSTPYSLHVFPSYYCNFKCSYCLHSLPEEQLLKMLFKKQIMDMDIYKKAIDSLKEFPEKLKAIIFAGHGEPLIHKDIDKMVGYAKKYNVADRLEMVTNASLLTHDLSDRLISAGLDRLRISIQGVTAQKYREVSGVKLDLEKFVENIQYFYSRQTNTEVYIKIIDVSLENEEEKQLFYNVFKPIADVAAIEYAIPFVPEIDYTKFNTEFDKCKQGHKHISNICSMPFYMLVLDPVGNILPCCSTTTPIVYGNINQSGLKEIWESKKVKKFLYMQLKDRNENNVCSKCSVPAFGLQEGDYLDEYAEELLKYYK